MKKTLLTVIVLGLLVSQSYAGGIWSMIKNSGLEKRDAKAISIEVAGVNIRAYIFDVPEMKSICISTWGDGEQQLECKTYKEIGK